MSLTANVYGASSIGWATSEAKGPLKSNLTDLNLTSILPCIFTCREASRSISDAFLALALLETFRIRGQRAIIPSRPSLEVLDLNSDQCDKV